jgi:hypothetical protein
VTMAAASTDAITESGRPIAHDAGVLSVVVRAGVATIHLGAGTYYLATQAP